MEDSPLLSRMKRKENLEYASCVSNLWSLLLQIQLPQFSIHTS